MAVEIIPDKICPHCGDNRWIRRFHKENNRQKCCISYSCANKIVEYRKTYRKNHQNTTENKEKIRLSTNITRQKGRDNLSDWYIRSYIASKEHKSSKDVTIEEIICKRKQIEIYRERYKSISKENRAKIYDKNYEDKNRIYLSDPYIKKIIQRDNRRKGIYISMKDIPEKEIIKRRAKIIANRKNKLSMSYTKRCMQSSIIKSGGRVSIRDISKRKTYNYRKGLRMIRYTRELTKLLTT